MKIKDNKKKESKKKGFYFKDYTESDIIISSKNKNIVKIKSSLIFMNIKFSLFNNF